MLQEIPTPVCALARNDTVLGGPCALLFALYDIQQGRRGRRPLHYIFVGATLAVALNPIWRLEDRTIQMYNPKRCHPERNAVEPRDLRILDLRRLKLVRRSFDSLRSLRMTDLVDRA